MAKKRRKIRVGTRGSALALAQTQIVVDQLSALQANLEFDIKTIKTAGDRVSTPEALAKLLRKPGRQGVFVKEIDQALLGRKIDIGIHSLKDVPTHLLDGLKIAAVLKREKANDLFVGRTGEPLERLAAGAVIGTSSPRRRAQVRAAFPHLEVTEIRGNLDTRIQKLMDKKGKLDGIIVSAAAFRRLFKENGVPVQELPLDRFVPAPGQGVIGVICRERDEETQSLLKRINDPDTMTEVTAERALLARMEAGCTVPMGALAQADESGLVHLRAMVGDPEAGRVISAEATGQANEPDDLAAAVETILKARGAEEILDAARSKLVKKRR